MASSSSCKEHEFHGCPFFDVNLDVIGGDGKDVQSRFDANPDASFESGMVDIAPMVPARAKCIVAVQVRWSSQTPKEGLPANMAVCLVNGTNKERCPPPQVARNASYMVPRCGVKAIIASKCGPEWLYLAAKCPNKLQPTTVGVAYRFIYSDARKKELLSRPKEERKTPTNIYYQAPLDPIVSFTLGLRFYLTAKECPVPCPLPARYMDDILETKTPDSILKQVTELEAMVKMQQEARVAEENAGKRQKGWMSPEEVAALSNLMEARMAMVGGRPSLDGNRHPASMGGASSSSSSSSSSPKKWLMPTPM